MAAGRSQRFGRDKTLEPLDGRPLALHALAACLAFDRLVVASQANRHLFDGVPSIVNDEPERGMTHSLRLADALVPRDRGIVVLLADMPFVPASSVASVARALRAGADVAYPFDGRRPGHPVGFGPRARARLHAVPDGDTLRELRDDPALRATRIPTSFDDRARDIDVPHDLLAPARRGTLRLDERNP